MFLRAERCLASSAMLVLAAFVALLGGCQAALLYAPVRHPAGSAFPAGLPLSIAACFAGVTLTVLALRRRRSPVVVIASVLNLLLALCTLLLLVAGTFG